MSTKNTLGAFNGERWLASRKGLIRYEGTPCSICESTLRYVSSGRCVQCSIKSATESQRRKKGEV